jgi:hypothetical protein
MAPAADTFEGLQASARQQPGAVTRTSGIKFQCPGCLAEGHDTSQGNAILFNDGSWGCAVAKDTPVGRQHWEAIGRALGAFNGRTHGMAAKRPPASSAPFVWPAPTALPTGLPKVPVFDVDEMLPRAFATWVGDIAERAQCPPDFVGVASLVALASVIGRQMSIRPKVKDDWTVVPNLWGAAIGRPGVMKSPALEEALRPLQRLAVEARQD